jgi:hypothetical protein
MGATKMSKIKPPPGYEFVECDEDEPVTMMDANRPWLDYDWRQIKTAEDLNDARAAVRKFKKDYRAWLDNNDIWTHTGKPYSEAMKNANELEQHKYCKTWYIRICRVLKKRGVL